MEFIELLCLEVICGYLLQCFAFIVGMHGFAKKKMNMKMVLLSSAASALVTYIVRIISTACGITFGVHTLLMLLVINTFCVLLCKLDIKSSITGSIIMMILVLVSELVNVAILKLANMEKSMDEIQTLINSTAIMKATTAIPGNVLLLLVALLFYYFRVKRNEKKEV